MKRGAGLTAILPLYMGNHIFIVCDSYNIPIIRGPMDQSKSGFLLLMNLQLELDVIVLKMLYKISTDSSAEKKFLSPSVSFKLCYENVFYVGHLYPKGTVILSSHSWCTTMKII